jgi:hypothetical protein
VAVAHGTSLFAVEGVSAVYVAAKRVMTPVETLARLAAIVPLSRLVIGGVTASCARPPARAHPLMQVSGGREQEARLTPPAREAGDGRAAFALDVPLLATASLTTSGLAEHLAPHVLSIAHWERILEGELYASSSRLDWRTVFRAAR